MYVCFLCENFSQESAVVDMQTVSDIWNSSGVASSVSGVWPFAQQQPASNGLFDELNNNMTMSWTKVR